MLRTTILALVVAAVLAVSWRWGSFVVGGSDSSCYVTQAQRWAAVMAHPWSASLQPADPLAAEAPWLARAAAFVPTGHIPSPSVPGAFVPVCPAGLAIVMAPLYLLGGSSLMFFAIPLFGVVLVLSTYRLGSRFEPRVGVAAAVLVAASPVFLYQLVQPMSDVPAAALWLLAVAAATGTKPRDVVIAGAATSAAVLIRPNLVPLGFAIGLFVMLRPERAGRQRLRSAAVYAACSAPGCIAVALIQRMFYGSPLASGYGSYDLLFSMSHVVPNLRRYVEWLVTSHTPFIALALLAPVLLPGSVTLLLLALTAINVALYLPYVVFDAWGFVRFLLPSIPLLLVLSIAVVDAVIVRLSRRGISPAEPRARSAYAWSGAAMAVVLAALFVQQARAHSAFRLRDMEARFERAGRYVDRRLPANALLITSYESGSVPFYSGRRTLVWDQLDSASLDRAVLFARARGFAPYLLFERWEEPAFRAQFPGSALGALDWPPVAEVARQVHIYRPEDRERYRQGGAVPTEFAP